MWRQLVGFGRQSFVFSLILSMLTAARAADAGTDSAAAGSETVPEWLSVWDYQLWGIEAWRLVIGIGVILAALVVNTALRYSLKKRQEKADAEEAGTRKSLIGFVFRAAVLPIHLIVWALAIRVLRVVLFPQYMQEVAYITETLFSLSVAAFVYKLVDMVEYFFGRYAENTETKLDDMLVPAVRKTLRVLVVIIAGLHIYQSISEGKISTLLASLGIGGLAFALAAQDTLKNLFGFFMILADRPFLVGERINFAGHDGVVEAVGFRSVRLRRLDGHQVTVPNSRAADDVIHNIARRPYIKRVMNIGITYDTPVAKVEEAVTILQDILKDHEGMDEEFPPRVYFKDFAADSLGIMAIYWYHPPAYWDYMDHAQKVNLELMRRYEEAGIEFAFPTQTMYLAGDPKRELSIRLTGGADIVPEV